MKLKTATVMLYPCCTHCPPPNDCTFWGDKSLKDRAKGHKSPCVFSGHYDNGWSECKKGATKVAMRIMVAA